MLDLVAHPTEPGELFGRGQGTFISHPTGSISAFSWAESLSVSTGSPELQIHVFSWDMVWLFSSCQGIPNQQLVLHQFLTSINCLIN